MAANKFHLNIARKFRRNDFRTSKSTVEDELRYYMDQFKDKIVLCNCNDDENSEFFRYFQRLFEVLGLKKLIGVHYESEQGKPSYKLELYKDTNNDGQVTWKDEVIKTPIYGDEKYTAGDFRSKDCIELLKEADIVVTNPPFSLLREFVAQLIEYNKKFLILGNTNAIGYKEIFPLLKENKIWLGISIRSGAIEFIVPSDYDVSTATGARLDKKGNKFIKIGGIRWFTNLKTEYRQSPLQLIGNYYTKESYPKYDNYDAINVDKVTDIPCDYPGIMGVPLTFMDKYCPEQFEIVGITSGRKEFSKESHPILRYINPKQHNADGTLKNGSKVNTGPTLVTKDSSRIYYTADNINYKVKKLYTRILVKNKQTISSKYRNINIKEHVLNKTVDAGIALELCEKTA